MTIYYEDYPLSARFTGAGGMFEMEDREFLGRPHRMFKYSPRTFGELIAKVVNSPDIAPESPMCEQDAVVTTYGAAFATASALKQILIEDLGVKAGDHVAIAMGNRVEWMISLFAIAAAGGVPVLVNNRGAGEEIHRAISIADCHIVIADQERHAISAPLLPPDVKTVLLGDNPDALSQPGTLAFPTPEQAAAAPPLEFIARAPEDPALIMFSSGTTGFPKAILHSQNGLTHALTLGCLINEVHDSRFEEEFGEILPRHLKSNYSTAVISGPMFHVNGILPFMRSVMNGQLSILMNKWNVDTAFDLLERGDISRLGLVPTMIFDMLNSPRAANGGLSRLCFLGSGTAPLTPEVGERLRKVLPRCLLYNSYGQTETLERVASFNGQEFISNLNAVGRVLPGVQMQIVRDDDTPTSADDAGEIATRSPSNMLCYYNDEAATRSTIRDGWILSGDIGRFNDANLLHVIDRKKNMVISGGENIYCAEVERVLAEHPAAIEAIAYGEHDDRLGERLVATVVVRPDAETSEEEMKAYTKGRLAIYKVPRRIDFTITPLPRTPTGKVARGDFLKGAQTQN